MSKKKYRLVITNVFGYKLSELQQRVAFFFWKKVGEQGPNEHAGDWYDRVVKITGQTKLRIIEKIIP